MSRRPFRARRLARWLRGAIDDPGLIGLGEEDRSELLYRASLLLEQGGFADATRLFSLAVQLWPRSADALLGLGACRQVCGNPNEAISCYDRALSVRPGDLFALANRAECSLLAGDVETARRDLSAISNEAGSVAGKFRERVDALRRLAESGDPS